MEFLALFLILMTMVVYPVFVVRSALKGKRWAREALEAMRYMGGEMMTTSAWRPLPPEPDPPQPEETAQALAEDDEAHRGRLVA